MSKLRCRCGQILSDTSQNDSDLHWGRLVPRGEWDESIEKVADALAEMCEAYRRGDHRSWVEAHCPVYSDQPFQGMLSDMLTMLTADLGLDYARCTKCGTYMIQRSDTETEFDPYHPAPQTTKNET